MDTVPVAFLAYSFEITELPEIPGRIKSISQQAFMHTLISGSIEIPGNVKVMDQVLLENVLM